MKFSTLLRHAQTPFTALLLFGAAGIIAMVVALYASPVNHGGDPSSPVVSHTPSASSSPSPEAPAGTDATVVDPKLPPAPDVSGAPPAVPVQSSDAPQRKQDHHRGHHGDEGD